MSPTSLTGVIADHINAVNTFDTDAVVATMDREGDPAVTEVQVASDAAPLADIDSMIGALLD